MPISGLEPYDDSNIFARIMRGEIPAKRIYEDEYALAFHDVNPQAPVHALVIPQGRYVSLPDFVAKANPAEITGFFRAVGHVAEMLGLKPSGYRMLSNHGTDAGQEVGHFHVHILGGTPLGPLVAASA